MGLITALIMFSLNYFKTTLQASKLHIIYARPKLRPTDKWPTRITWGATNVTKNIFTLGIWGWTRAGGEDKLRGSIHPAGTPWMPTYILPLFFKAMLLDIAKTKELFQVFSFDNPTKPSISWAMRDFVLGSRPIQALSDDQMITPLLQIKHKLGQQLH